MTDVLIIGSGMAGLACARRLSEAGQKVLVLDKGRGIGGRLATKRVEGMQFDHGAQFVTARDAGFAAALQGLGGAVAPWEQGQGLVGVPGMSALPRAMAAGLDIRQGVQVTSLRHQDGTWQVQTETEVLQAATVVLTVPAPQVAGLLGDHPLVAEVAQVRLAPCLTLMAAVDAPPPFVTRRDPLDDLAWIALDMSKPGRPAGPSLWVAQAGEAFSEAHLEESPEAIASLMLPLLCDRLGVGAEAVRHAQAHRWRYARVTKPLGRPFAAQDGLYLGGDWCIGPRVEAAWISGQAIAEAILASETSPVTPQVSS